MSFDKLKKEVVDSGLCRICGACVAACKPGVIEVDDGPNLIDECVECGLCTDVCPEINDLDSFGLKELDRERSISVRSRNPEVIEKSQDGGAVTSILISLLNKNEIDAAVVVGQTDSWKPIPYVVTRPEEVLESAGTKFGSAAILSKVRKASQHGEIAVVGTPCQIEAAKILNENGVGNIKYYIGVFCMKNFQHQQLFKVITDKAECDACDIEKIGINKGKFNYKINGSESILELSEINHCVRPVCKECSEFESKHSDISVGSIASSNGWSTLIIRNEKGKKIYNTAKKDLKTKKLKTLKPIDKLAKIKQKQTQKQTQK
ncbi:Coenzyme F420-reducing hydrogenase beta subunit [Methanonatronarchaeum thermophilum]|uniref:Coenzyme F420-reducing hydrogenase beta subunit n=1 Tax=Methanonatronarchaeum thermophilum TaxID=1927129 RepID=A0A1Y3GDY4_9EURY|nr:Coenzyme F420 hydrogenase/dehydrogenase, beta subunit C-terminal domain [Methanonatronarchaeum thermophilum]OUJ19470.1 Coenzyme F420-reducing hydrogenase beta subunit [Methanonatronarchaeum thermophilum]